MGVDRQHESQEARSLYPSALQLTRALRLEFVGRFDPPDARAGANLQVDRIYLLCLSCSQPTFWFGQVMAITGVRSGWQ
jgi:hypothetical protein